MGTVEVDGLAKQFGSVRAVDDITFTVEDGEVFGFLGPNGAGKTTTIRTLLGYLTPTSGAASVLGADCTDESAMLDARRRLGYLPANPSFEEGSTGREILDLHGSIKGQSRRAALLELFDPPLDRPVRAYSSGNVQKLGLVQAFIHDPDLVILDEPTSGLDPLLQQRFNDFLRAERERGTTVFFSSHVLSEVRQTCDRVGILRNGRLVTVEPIDTLLGHSGKFVRARIAGRVPRDAFDDPAVHDLDCTVADDGVDQLLDEHSDATAVTELTFTYTGDVNALLASLQSYQFVDLDLEEAPLEDVFMRFYGEDGQNVSADGGDGGV